MRRPKCIILCGIPGAGKSTYAKNYIKQFGGSHLSSDSIRQELYGDESIQGDSNEVFSIMQQRAIEVLNNGQDVIYDSTAMTRKDRSYIIELCPKFVQIEAHIIWAPIETCIERDATRERTVGKEVIDKMLKRFQAPYYDENIDIIKIVRPDGWNKFVEQYISDFKNAMKIPHDNPHHTLNIYDHCDKAFEYFDKKGEINLAIAAFLHDMGKPYVKAFINSKGESSEIAHFYQHQCISSYMSYGVDVVTPFIAWLISTHMDPVMNTKYYRRLPKYLKDQVDLLHEADKAAH